MSQPYGKTQETHSMVLVKVQNQFKKCLDHENPLESEILDFATLDSSFNTYKIEVKIREEILPGNSVQ